MDDSFFNEINDALNICEKDFIYNTLEIANSSKNSNSAYRFWFNDFRNNFLNREGDIYEFGVYRGASLLSIALLAKRLGSKKHFWGFDTFSGFPQFSEEDKLTNFTKANGFSEEIIANANLLSRIKLSKNKNNDERLSETLSKIGKSGLFQDTSYEDLLNKIDKLSLSNITLIKGDFAETVNSHFLEKRRKVYSANIDCDLYKGYEICLPIIFENLVPNGYINLDEYYSLKYPGAKIATDKFLLKYKDAKLVKNQTPSNEFSRYYITK